MIEICVDCEKGYARISGHAEYAERGQDIVCAGVSAITQALVDMVAGRGDPDWVKIGLQDEVTIQFPPEWPGLENCLDMALVGWLEIEEEYPAYVKIVQPE